MPIVDTTHEIAGIAVKTQWLMVLKESFILLKQGETTSSAKTGLLPTNSTARLVLSPSSVSENWPCAFLRLSFKGLIFLFRLLSI